MFVFNSRNQHLSKSYALWFIARCPFLQFQWVILNFFRRGFSKKSIISSLNVIWKKSERSKSIFFRKHSFFPLLSSIWESKLLTICSLFNASKRLYSDVFCSERVLIIMQKGTRNVLGLIVTLPRTRASELWLPSIQRISKWLSQRFSFRLLATGIKSKMLGSSEKMYWNRLKYTETLSHTELNIPTSRNGCISQMERKILAGERSEPNYFFLNICVSKITKTNKKIRCLKISKGVWTSKPPSNHATALITFDKQNLMNASPAANKFEGVQNENGNRIRDAELLHCERAFYTMLHVINNDEENDWKVQINKYFQFGYFQVRKMYSSGKCTR